MTDKEWHEMLICLLQLEEEKYWDATIQKLNDMRAELKYLQIQRKPFTTRPLFSEPRKEFYIEPTISKLI